MTQVETNDRLERRNINESTSIDPRRALVRDLAWSYLERVRGGETPSLEPHLIWAPDEEAKEEIRVLVQTNLLARVALAWKRSVSTENRQLAEPWEVWMTE